MSESANEQMAAERMQQLAAAVATTVSAFHTFMRVELPALKQKLAEGLALEQPVRIAIAELNDFTLQWPQIPFPTMAEVALSLITPPTTKH